MLSESGTTTAFTGPVRLGSVASDMCIERRARRPRIGARASLAVVALAWASAAAAEPEVAAPEVAAPEVTAPEVTAPEVTAPEVAAPEVTAPEAVSATPPSPASAAPTAPPPADPSPAAHAAVEPAAPPSPLALTFALGGDLMHVDTDSQWGMTLRAGLQWSSETWRLHGAVGYAYSELEARAAAFDGYLGGALRATDWLDVGLYGSASVGSTGLFDPWYERTWAIGAELGECLDLSASAQLCFAQRIAPLGALTRRAVIVGGDVYRLPLETDRLIRAEATIGFRQEL